MLPHNHLPSGSHPDPYTSARRVVVVVALIVVLALVLAVAYVGRGLEGHAPPPAAGPVPAAGTARPPTGRRWFWDRSLWNTPPVPQP